MTGRKRTPTALHILRGNQSKMKLSTTEPTPAVLDETHPAPEWLDPESKREWARVAPILARNGLLTEMDTDALTAYCSTWATWRDANQKIRQFGAVVKAGNGAPMPSPYLSISHHAMGELRRFMIEFGMTPSSRARVQKQPDTTKVRSKWAGELG